LRLPRLFLQLALVALLSSFALTACDDDDFCEPGRPCGCAHGDECYLGCEGDGCHQTCHDLVRCGGVCGNVCSFNCHNMNDCSVSCGDDCAATCHDTVSCGIICGANCDYRCNNASRCGAEVGPGSVVQCRGLTSCEVTCLGDCEVSCEGVGRCQVWCGADDPTPTDCTNGASCGC
jgi:hypothetical protein